ncbi:efflux RND transporter periplasmic adaptor subunit [Klebsiella pneumoniae]|uniref:efflux RND transporter periplasmic adaptor subunit n=1 Tax=Klebsiella pneumoniae TaxID=573 RepID=UPI001E2E16A2|nr:efflux RND transporter periplasmic adaptor subunit [Klebsiella pneumoniae]MCC4960185.1 efflux RND transporter periplasmic adaptor subunit [Klebsiella pneumoniae]
MSELKFSSLVLLCAVLVGCKQEQTPSAAGKKTVIVESVHLQPVSTSVTLTGRTSETLISQVRPQVTGIIQKRAFREGDLVSAGQVLYLLDPSSYKAAYDQAVAAVDSAKAELFSAKLKYQRYERLISSHVISQQDVDDALSVYKQDTANVAEKKAALETAAINLARTTIRSPISGIAGVSTVTPGALVTANQSNALTDVRKLDPIYVDLQEPAELWGQLKVANAGKNEQVHLMLGNSTLYSEAGKLELAETAVDPATGTVQLRAVFPNPSHTLLPGMFVRAVLPGMHYSNAALVPQSAVTFAHNGQASVLTVTVDGKVKEVAVITNGDFKGNWIVTQGLSDGDRVITAGNNRVSPGDEVTIKKVKEPGAS